MRYFAQFGMMNVRKKPIALTGNRFIRYLGVLAGCLNIIEFYLYKSSIHNFATLVNDLATFLGQLCDKKQVEHTDLIGFSMILFDI